MPYGNSPQVSVRACPGAEPGEMRIGVSPRDRAPFVGLDLCISKGIGYVQGTYLCRVSVTTVPPGTDTTPKSWDWAQPTSWPLSHQCLTAQRSKSQGIIVVIQARE